MKGAGGGVSGTCTWSPSDARLLEVGVVSGGQGKGEGKGAAGQAG